MVTTPVTESKAPRIVFEKPTNASGTRKNAREVKKRYTGKITLDTFKTFEKGK